MTPLLPGRAAVARHDGKITLIACDEPGNLPLGSVRFEVKAVLHEISVSDTSPEYGSLPPVLPFRTDKSALSGVHSQREILYSWSTYW